MVVSAEDTGLCSWESSAAPTRVHWVRILADLLDVAAGYQLSAVSQEPTADSLFRPVSVMDSTRRFERRRRGSIP